MRVKELSNAVVRRPSTVTVASVLWQIAGGVVVLWGVALTNVEPATFRGVNIVVVQAVCLVIGVVCWRWGKHLRYGRDVRLALTILGVVSSLLILPVLFALPALILQHVPLSRNWFALPARRTDPAV